MDETYLKVPGNWRYAYHAIHQFGVLDLDPQNLVQMAAPNDQQPVQALGPDSADQPLWVGVRGRRPHRCHDHLGVDGT